MAGMSILVSRLEEFKCDANEAVSMKLVRDQADFEDEGQSFHPDMSHQIFGESESIFGYKDLQVSLYYSAGRLITYLGIKYSEKVSAQEFDGVIADDIEKQIAEQIPPGYMTNSDDFLASLDKEVNFKPFGELLHSYKVEKEGRDRHFEIYRADISVPGFREYHERLQTFLLWYIDAASYIDVDDDRWVFYLIFEKYHSVTHSQQMYAIAGYMTAYSYYAYPANTRPRMSQVLVLPPFQRMGHCARLIQTFYNDVVPRPEVLDVTVEDPSENFQKVRDFVDAKNCLKLDTFQPESLKEGFTDSMAKEAQMKLKLNKRQARRVYEILRLKAVDPKNAEEVRGYRLDIKRRLNKPFEKNGRDLEKLQRVLEEGEYTAAMNAITGEQKFKILQEQYEQQVEGYRSILDRLATWHE
ncbi:histone acetyltransferase type B catalytic subunit [Lingula anatina]|uniref:Histone acetyltransferase type B catalytic subunit n=1 Tax=Lingula anatina TaxID=7574 RepID=A0A1S3IAS7_LINAN|nr:histone acetyltransferase type B catalytic subunit [Lingula anatina]|eukprot:XP_013395370.1 histone acetyltransferase type B catalytic subunit [Lingula anatina]